MFTRQSSVLIDRYLNENTLPIRVDLLQVEDYIEFQFSIKCDSDELMSESQIRIMMDLVEDVKDQLQYDDVNDCMYMHIKREQFEPKVIEILEIIKKNLPETLMYYKCKLNDNGTRIILHQATADGLQIYSDLSDRELIELARLHVHHTLIGELCHRFEKLLAPA